MVHTARVVPAPRAPIVIGAGERCRMCAARPYSPCAVVPDDGLEVLARVAAHTRFRPGQELVAEGTSAEHFFNVTRGTVKLYKLLSDGRRQIVGFLSTGGFLGLALEPCHPFSAEAVDAVEACRFSRRDLHGLMSDFRAFERRLHAVTSHELVAAQEQMMLLGRKTAVERVASFLLLRARHQAACGRANETVELPMTRADIADHLGLRLETVSRALRALVQGRAIALDGPDRVVLLDRRALAEAAAEA